jgi:hypothetical protein
MRVSISKGAKIIELLEIMTGQKISQTYRIDLPDKTRELYKESSTNLQHIYI